MISAFVSVLVATLGIVPSVRHAGAGASGIGASGTIALTRQQEIPANRIVSLVPAATEILFAMGAGDSVIGVSSYDTWPPEVLALPKLGGLLDPDQERILRMRPQVAIVDAGQRALARKLETAGIDTFRFRHADLASSLASIEEIGRAIGRTREGADLAARVGDELEAVRRANSGPAVPALIVFGRNPGSFQNLWVIGGAGFTSELLEIAGGANVFGDVAMQSFKVGLEAVLARSPRAVLELRPARGRVVDSDALAAEWRGLPGFGDLHVAVLTDDSMLVPGPRMARAARLLAVQLRAADR